MNETPLPRKSAWIQDLSVVIPVKNEAGNIIPLLAEIQKALEGLVVYEMIYVNDASTDTTLSELRAAKARFRNLRVISHDQSCGQSRALRSGIMAARHPWIVTLDGDGQNDPGDIPKLIREISPDIQLIIGNRRLTRQDSWIRKISSTIANGVRSSVLRDQTPDTGCGLKLIHREMFLNLPYFDHMHRFLPALILREGGKTRSVPVGHRPRSSGQSKYGTLDRLMAGVVDLLGVVWLIHRSKRPNIREE